MFSNNSDIDDATLIQKFVQGETELVGNSNLRLNSSGGQIQLTTTKSEIIGMLKFIEKRRSALIKAGCPHWQIIHQILSENNFVQWGDSKQKGFIEYQQWEPPAGYRVNYTETVVLWKTWWPTQRYQNKHALHLNILIFWKKNWYPLQEIEVHQRIFTIKTLVGQMTIPSTEKILWAKQLPKEATINPTPVTTSSTNTPANANLIDREADNKLIRPQEDDNNSPKCEFKSSTKHKIKTETETKPNTEELLKNIKTKAIQTFANYLEEVAQIQTERISMAENRAKQAEKRAELMAAKLWQMGIDPNKL